MVRVAGPVPAASDSPSRDRRPRPHLLCCLLAVHCWTAAALAGSPRAELLRLVPEDVGFCLILEDIRGQGRALAQSPFINQFRTSPLGDKIRGAPETKKLSELEHILQRHLEVTATELREEIFGEALVLAYRPGPPGKPDEEQGLFLIWARDATLLASLVERINTLQKDSGDLSQLEQRDYHGARYYRRVERGRANFYYLHGPLLAFAPREAILRQLIDLERDAPRGAESPIARQLGRLGVNKCLAALWVNPRAFDAALADQALAQKPGAAARERAAALRTLSVYWKALEGIALSVTLDRELSVAVAVRAKLDELPPAARRLLQAAARPSAVWRHLPDDALLTIAGRVDVPALAETLGEFLTDDARKSLRAMIAGTVEAILGKDSVQNMLPGLGPDWGICLVAPSASDQGWLPQIIGAVRVLPGQAGIPADVTVGNALRALAALAVFHHNRGQPGPLRLKSALRGKIEVNYLVNEEQFPPGVQPAFALKGGYLVLASAPAAIDRFHATAVEATPPRAGDIPLLHLSLAGWCRYLRAQRESVLAYAAAKNQMTREEAGKRLDHLLMVLQLFDAVELSQRSSSNLVILTLRVRTAQPLR